ncbi:hypothetical protein N7530_007452 [Penicillium desertorum]|uniref:Uncharacterized protein n=1 Tax=Penicillium desertorum TaxID=1303715 RepID=A0A9W9WMA9_9EURO|nr:hypothetical protein N7530_007452 [Penicillium desertorum]
MSAGHKQPETTLTVGGFPCIHDFFSLSIHIVVHLVLSSWNISIILLGIMSMSMKIFLDNLYAFLSSLGHNSQIPNLSPV